MLGRSHARSTSSRSVRPIEFSVLTKDTAHDRRPRRRMAASMCGSRSGCGLIHMPGTGEPQPPQASARYRRLRMFRLPCGMEMLSTSHRPSQSWCGSPSSSTLWMPSSMRARPLGVITQCASRPTLVAVIQPARAHRPMAWRAAYSSIPATWRVATRVRVGTLTAGSSANSPSALSRTERALPRSRRVPARGLGIAVTCVDTADDATGGSRRTDYLPRNCGSRRSMKAARPSRQSSVAISVCCSRASTSRWLAMSRHAHWRTAFLVIA